jgi:hypothetical protein
MAQENPGPDSALLAEALPTAAASEERKKLRRSGFAGERMQYTLSQVIPLGLMILIGLLLYALGRRTRRQEVPADTATATPATDLGS